MVKNIRSILFFNYFNVILAFDLHVLAVQASNNELYDASAAFFELLLRQTENEEKLGKLNYSHLWNFKITVQRAEQLVKLAYKVHDEKLIKRGQYGRKHRCNKHPFDPNVKKKKRYRDPANVTTILDRETLDYLVLVKERKPIVDIDFQISTTMQVDKLCRGTQLRVLVFSIYRSIQSLDNI